MIAIIQAACGRGYRIRITFSTGEVGVTNREDVMKRYPVDRPVLDPEQFSRFFIDDWPTRAWPCGFDLAPEMLYKLATGKPPTRLQAPNERSDPKSHSGTTP